jgi:hypothetical protein
MHALVISGLQNNKNILQCNYNNEISLIFAFLGQHYTRIIFEIS